MLIIIASTVGLSFRLFFLCKKKVSFFMPHTNSPCLRFMVIIIWYGRFIYIYFFLFQNNFLKKHKLMPYRLYYDWRKQYSQFTNLCR